MRVLAAAISAAWLASAASASDAAPRETGQPATSRLREAYRKAKDPDERFWIVDALERRLRSGRDERALEALVEAAADSQPDVRRRALAGLEGWRTLEPAEQEGWRERVVGVAKRAADDRDPRVREAAASLKGTLRAPAKGAAPERSSGTPAGRTSRRRAAVTAALWAVCAQLAVLAWARLMVSVLRQSGQRGARGLACLETSVSRMDYLVFPSLSVALLVCLMGVGGGIALVGALAPAARQLSTKAWLAGAAAMYVACGLSAFVPAALLARRAARYGAAPGAVLALWRSLGDLPGAVLLGLAVLVLQPLRPLRGLLAAAASAGPAASWRRAWTEEAGRAVDDAAGLLARPFTEGPLLAVYLAAPAVMALGSLPPQFAGAPPIGLFELFFVSDAGFAWIFGVWAAGMAVSGFLGLWLSAAAIHAAETVSPRGLSGPEGPGGRP